MPQIASALSDADLIQIFQERNNDPARGADFLPELAGGGGSVRGNEFCDQASHLFNGVVKQNNSVANLNDLALLDQEAERLL